MDIQEVINQIAAGDSAAAKEGIENVLSAKAFDALQSRKQEIAATLFGGQEQEHEEVTDNEEAYAESVEHDGEQEQLDEKVFHTINGRGHPWEGGVNTYNLIKKYKDPKTKENVHVVQRVHSAGAGKQDPSKHEVIVTDKDHKRIVGQTHMHSGSLEDSHKIAKHYIKHGLTGIGVGRTWSIGSFERPAQKGEVPVKKVKK
jgi:hypothetical protein